MGFSRDYKTYTQDERNILLLIEKGPLQVTFEDKKSLLHWRHRMYALRSAMSLAYERETKGVAWGKKPEHEFSDPFISITPRIIQMTILVDDLTATIGLGIMRPGVQSVIEKALMAAGFETGAQQHQREAKERERAILAEINSPAFGAAAQGNALDTTLDELGYSVAARMKAKAAKAATGPLDMTAALTSLNTQETLALARTEALAAQAAARTAPRELSPEERAAEEEEILKLSINQTN